MTQEQKTEVKAAQELLSDLQVPAVQVPLVDTSTLPDLSTGVQVTELPKDATTEQKVSWLNALVAQAKAAWGELRVSTRKSLEQAFAFGKSLEQIKEVCGQVGYTFRTKLVEVAPVKYNMAYKYIRLYKHREEVLAKIAAMPEGERSYWQEPSNAMRLTSSGDGRKKPAPFKPVLTSTSKDKLDKLLAKHHLTGTAKDAMAFLVALGVSRQMWSKLEK